MPTKAIFTCPSGRVEIALDDEPSFKVAAQFLRSRMNPGRRPCVRQTAQALTKAVAEGQTTFVAGFAKNKASCRISR